MLSLSLAPLSLSSPVVSRVGAPQMMAKVKADVLVDLADGQNIPGLPSGTIWDPLDLGGQDFWAQVWLFFPVDARPCAASQWLLSHSLPLSLSVSCARAHLRSSLSLLSF